MLLAAGGLAWLSYGDRRSPLALDLVEWDTRLGVPVCGIVAAVGLLLLVASFLGRKTSTPTARRRSPPRRARPAKRSADPVSDAPTGEGWLAEVVAKANALVWEEGVSLTVDAGPNVPFELRLHRATPERIRRSVGIFSAFLSAIPTPRRARVVFDECLESEVPRHKQVEGIFRRHFPMGSVRSVGSRDHVDLVFARPDGRWAQFPRLPVAPA